MMLKRNLKGDAAKLIRAMVEPLEQRRLLSVALMSSPMPLGASGTDGITPSATQPIIVSSNPPNGAANIPRYQFISLNVQLISAAHGVDTNTLNLNTVRINRASDNQFVNANLTPDAAGGNITITPTALLAANTTYKVTVTSGLK